MKVVPGATYPSPTRDLDSPEQVELMVRRFYGDVAQDELLGPIFNDVAQVDWSEHLPKLTLFWSRFLFGVRGYDGNPFRSHAAVHDRQPFTPEAFVRWLELFEETLDLYWVGPNVERVRRLAHNVARVHREQLLGTPSAEGSVAT